MKPVYNEPLRSRWPMLVELGRVSYDIKVFLEYIEKNTRVASVRAALGGAS
jgi:hypothetical protein